MSRWAILAGIIVTSVLLFQFQSGKIGTDDVFMLVSFDEEAGVRIERRVETEDFRILAFGDIMLGRYVRILMDIHGMDYVFENIYGENGWFFDADVVFGNLEGPIMGSGRSGGTSMVFAFNEDVAPFLKNYGFDVLSVTNNHSLDQRWEGRDATVSALENAGIGWCGHPMEADFNSVYYGQIGEKSYSFICLNGVNYGFDEAEAIDLVRLTSANVDYSIVSIHWGSEYRNRPSGSQIALGRAFVDEGADFVIGHHPHVVQSFEEYNGKLIFYSLGNFIFDQYWSSETQKELALGIILEEDSAKVYLFPMLSERSKPRLMDAAEYERWIEEFINYGDYNEELKQQIRSGIINL